MSGFLVDRLEPSFGQTWPRIRGHLRRFSGQICRQTGPKTMRKWKKNLPRFSWGPNKHDSIHTFSSNRVQTVPIGPLCLFWPLPDLIWDQQSLKNRKQKRKEIPKLYDLFPVSLQRFLMGSSADLPEVVGDIVDVPRSSVAAVVRCSCPAVWVQGLHHGHQTDYMLHSASPSAAKKNTPW